MKKEFKVGDKVLYIGETEYYSHLGFWCRHGQIYEIVGIVLEYGYIQLCQQQIDHDEGFGSFDDFELVEEPNPALFPNGAKFRVKDADIDPEGTEEWDDAYGSWNESGWHSSSSSC